MHPAVLRWPSGRSPLIIYKAKMSSLDAGCYIDIQLACGAGLEPTKAFLRESSEPDAKELLAVLEDGEYTGTLKASRPNGISIFIAVPTGSRRSASESGHFRNCAGFRTPESRDPPHDEVTGVRKTPRHEIAGWGRQWCRGRYGDFADGSDLRVVH
jgi:hypothetical protein